MNGSGGASPASGGSGGASATGGTPSDGGDGASGAGGSESGTASGFRVVGYMPSWSGDVSTIQYDKLTHINYAFALPTPEGGLAPVENEPKLADLVASGHQNGVKVLISIGGWNDGDDSAFHALAATEETRTAFADTVAAYVTSHDLDGADIDWEYPEDTVASEYTDLMSKLAERLHPEGKLVTAAVSASSWGSGGITPAAYALMDYLLLMAYDGGDGAEHSPYEYAVAALDFWLGTKGLPPEQAVLGIPFYARPSWTPYRTIVMADATAAFRDETNGDYYNGIPTVQAKTALALDRASGVMMWELSQDTLDDTSLLGAIDATIHP